MKTPLTDNEGEVRELRDEDVNWMRPLRQALPEALRRRIGQRGAAESETSCLPIARRQYRP